MVEHEVEQEGLLVVVDAGRGEEGFCGFWRGSWLREDGKDGGEVFAWELVGRGLYAFYGLLELR